MKLNLEVAKLVDKWLPVGEHKEHERMLANQMIFALCETYANQSKWISVEDRLPNVGETVLCISEEGRISTEQYCKGQTGIYCEQTDSGFATHWQPLPEKQ